MARHDSQDSHDEPGGPSPEGPSPQPPAPGASAPSSTPAPGEAPARPEPASTPLRRLWPLALAAGVVAGLASWGAGEVALRALVPSYELTPEQSASQVQTNIETRRQLNASKIQTASVTYGAQGLVLGLLLGLAGGLSRRSGLRAARAAGIGLVLGGAAGAAVSAAVVPIYIDAIEAAVDNLTNDLTWPLRVHGGIWVAVGLAAGASLGLGVGGWRLMVQGAIGGALGAVAGTLLYEIGGAIAFPTGKVSQPIAEAVSPRLLAHLGVSLLVAAGAAWGVRSLQLSRTASAPPPTKT